MRGGVSGRKYLRAGVGNGAMANGIGNTRAPGEFVVWLGRLLMTLVADENLRVHPAIARATLRARAANPRGE